MFVTLNCTLNVKDLGECRLGSSVNNSVFPTLSLSWEVYSLPSNYNLMNFPDIAKRVYAGEGVLWELMAGIQ
jgi:hypothetical protein